MTRTWFDRCYSRLLEDEPIVPDPRLRSLYECGQGVNKGKPGPCPQPGGADATAAQPAAATQQPAKVQGGGKQAGQAAPDSSTIMSALGFSDEPDPGTDPAKHAAFKVEAAEFEKAITTPEGVTGLRAKLSEQTQALDVEMKQAKGIKDKDQRAAAVEGVQAKLDSLNSVDEALKHVEAGFEKQAKSKADLKSMFDNLAQQGLDPRDIIRKLAGLAGAGNIAGQFLGQPVF